LEGGINLRPSPGVPKLLGEGALEKSKNSAKTLENAIFSRFQSVFALFDSFQ
jgi:hypothetical protein